MSERTHLTQAAACTLAMYLSWVEILSRNQASVCLTPDTGLGLSELHACATLFCSWRVGARVKRVAVGACVKRVGARTNYTKKKLVRAHQARALI